MENNRIASKLVSLYKTKIFQIASLVALFVVGFFLSYFFADKLKKVPEIPKENIVDESKIETKIIPDTQVDILLIGYGGPGHEGGSLSDVLINVVIDNEKKTATLISIPRDLWVTIPISSDKREEYKINMAHAVGADDAKFPYKEPLFVGVHGGGEMSKHVVGQVIGRKIDYYASINFANFTTAIDRIGGINVYVPHSFDDYFYPIKGEEQNLCGKSPEEMVRIHALYTGFELEKEFSCRYEHLHFEEGDTKMDGATALKFVRSRHSESHGGDFARSDRQKALLVGIKDTLISQGVDTRIIKFTDSMRDVLKTDMDQVAVKSLSGFVGDTKEYKVNKINLSTQNVLTESRSSGGASILVSKEGAGVWRSLQNFVQSELNK